MSENQDFSKVLQSIDFINSSDSQQQHRTFYGRTSVRVTIP